jgi:serine/threonine-protein kinase
MNALVSNDARLEEIGPYRVLHALSSRGTPSETLLAANEAGERVVLKGLGSADRGQRLLDPKIADEAREYSRLSHANLVKILDLFSADGRFFVALEYVDGLALQAVHAALADDRDVDAACWIYVASSIFAALAAAHGANILHRKVTPSNVQIAWDGTVKLGTFSMVDVVKVTHASVSSRYVAPEQKEGATAGPYTDVYSAMLIVRELLSDEGDLRPGAGARVSELIRAGLEQDPARRLNSAAHARDVFRAAIDMAGARKRFAAAMARMRFQEEAPVSRDVAPTRPCDVEVAAATRAPKGATPAEPEPVVESAPSTDDTPTVIRPPTDEELQALSALRPKLVAPPQEQPPRPGPRRPPPLPPRARAQRPPQAAAPPPVVELDVEPEPEPAAPAPRGPQALRAAFRVIRGALSSK